VGDISSSSINPDGDVELVYDYDTFQYPACPKCSGIMKPTVVFFGENINPVVREETFSVMDDVDCVLAMGTSLTVFSAFRLVKRAYDQGKPVVIVNRGPTRADDFATHRFNEPIATMLRDFTLS
jgi:NAD+-dependent protein deacetylase sirtuin 4